MPKIKKINFVFDERSLEPLEKLIRQGRAETGSTEVTFRDPETKEGRVMLIPKMPREDCLRGFSSSTFS